MTTRRQLGAGLAAMAVLAAGLGATVRAATSDDYDGPPNVFISPCGKPYRAPIGEAYPVAAWFKAADANGDGKLDRSEFLADCAAFFKELDANGDGVVDHREVSLYEHVIAPEVLGLRFVASYQRPAAGLYGGRIWRVQMADSPTTIVPGDNSPPEPRPPHDIDESGQGASPYGFFAEPEPVMAADENLNGIIRKDAFLRLAGRHFDRLDTDEAGFLTLAKLPRTPIQARVERLQRHGRRS